MFYYFCYELKHLSNNNKNETIVNILVVVSDYIKNYSFFIKNKI